MRRPIVARLRHRARPLFLGALGLALAASAQGCRAAHAPHVPSDPALRALPLYFYPASGETRGPMVFFFGNDVGFWEAHQQLAERLAGDGYPVVGFDERDMLKGLPSGPSAARERAWGERVDQVIAESRHELGADSLPIILGGHSIGAEIALWTAAHAPPPRLVGVLAMSPGSRGHLAVALSDVMNAGEPEGPDSFAVADQIAALPPRVRVAVVRGQRDDYRSADSALLAAGGSRARRYFIPFAGHSLKSVTVSGPIVGMAMRYLAGT